MDVRGRYTRGVTVFTVNNVLSYSLFSHSNSRQIGKVSA
jgi:hypothetical protein